MTMTFWLALGAAILSAGSIILHVVAPKTKNKWDDKFAELLDAIKSKVEK